MQAKDWWYLIAAVVSPVAAAFLTLLWQRRNEKHDIKVRLFSTLMAYRKASPFPPDAVQALNLIDVVFYKQEKIVRLWHELFDRYKSDPFPSADINHKLLDLLSAMAKHLSYRDIEQTQIDRWYTPKGVPQGVKISSPEAMGKVPQKHEVFGYVLPEHQDVQLLVYSPNGKWYPQGQVKRDGPLWWAVCAFGDSHSTAGDFQIVALAGCHRILQPIADLPHGAVKSSIVPVTRI